MGKHSTGRLGRAALAAAAILMPAPGGTAAAAGPAGDYRLVGEQDVASGLRLRPDGRFQYFLIAGALDEGAEGRWSVAGRIVTLTTEPKPVPPVFTQGASAKTKAAPLTIKVSWPGGRGIAGVDLRVGLDDGVVLDDYTQEDGWSLSEVEGRKPLWIELAVPMHGARSPRFPIDLEAGNALAFTFTPNDIGVFDFDGVKVELAGKALVVHREGAQLRYEPVRD
ncbi:MAG TPA: hypothetical protein VD846_10775 [Allosphingosinicella sp.]|nr:hypothetical protein [Allosphingosinicella sp.]